MLDECLSWNAHIEMIGIKISKAIGIISHLKLIYPQRILFTLYNSLIISHIGGFKGHFPPHTAFWKVTIVV